MCRDKQNADEIQSISAKRSRRGSTLLSHRTVPRGRISLSRNALNRSIISSSAASGAFARGREASRNAFACDKPMMVVARRNENEMFYQAARRQ